MLFVQLRHDIFQVKFRSQEDLAKTFIRFQETFESPKFRGKYFTLSKFKHWYTSNSPDGKKTGRFTFYQDWGGFNVPSYVLKPFLKGKFDPLSEEEKKLLEYFKNKKGKFYIIGTYGNRTKSVLEHEIAHALFYTNKKYKGEVLRVLHEIDSKTVHAIYHYLKESKGYHHDVWLDEVHAYTMTLLDLLKDEGVDISKLEKPNKELNEIFEKYFNANNHNG